MIDFNQERRSVALLRPPSRFGRDEIVNPCRRVVTNELIDSRNLCRGLERQRWKHHERKLRQSEVRTETLVRFLAPACRPNHREALGEARRRHPTAREPWNRIEGEVLFSQVRPVHRPTSGSDERDWEAVAAGAALGCALTFCFAAVSWWLVHRSHGAGADSTAALTDAAATVGGGAVGLAVGSAVAAGRSRFGRPLSDGFLAAMAGIVAPLSVLLLLIEPDDSTAVEYLADAAFLAIPLLAAGWLGANLGRDFRRGRVK